MTYVTATGFKRDSYAEIVRRCEAVILEVEPDADLSPEQPFGQIVTGMAELLSNDVEGAQEIYTVRSVNQATGTALDELLGELGMSRLAATPAQVDRVLCWTFQTFSLVYIPAGSQVRSTRSPLTYSLLADISIGLDPSGPFDAVRFSLDDTVVAGTVYRVVLNGVTFAYTAVLADTKDLVIGHLATLIAAGGYGATAETVSAVAYLRVEGTLFTATSLLNLEVAHQALAGTFVADAAQKQDVPAYWLDKIETAAGNWDAVEQPTSGIPGTDVETDTQARMRIRKTRRSGTATDEAIKAALLRVTGVSAALVISNRTMVTDADGRPPKSFEAIVTGGDDAAVASTIWRTMPSGIENWAPADQISRTVVDTSNQHQTIKFSRPIPVYVHVRVTITSYNSEQAFPAGGTGEEQIRQAVAAFGNAVFSLGQDIILQQLYAPVYQVPGIRFVTLEYALTTTPSGTPSWTAIDHLAVNPRSYGSFDVTRVVVVP